MSKTNIMRACKKCGKEFRLKYVGDKRKFCCKSCHISDKNKEKRLTLDELLKLLPAYVRIIPETFETTRSIATFIDLYNNESFKAKVSNVIHNGTRHPKYLKELEIKNNEEVIKSKLPSYVKIIDGTYKGIKQNSTFIDLEFSETFKALAYNVINGKSVCKGRQKEKSANKWENYRLESLEAYKKTLPSYLIIYDDSFTKLENSANFRDSEYNIDFKSRCYTKVIPKCKARYWDEFKKRSRLTEKEIQERLDKIYNRTVKIVYETYTSRNKAAYFIIDENKVSMNVSQALDGWIIERRGKYLIWRELIRQKWNFTCPFTGKTKDLHAHHLFGRKSFKVFEFDPNNGILLHKDIHREFHTKYGLKNNTKEQLLEFAKSKGIDLTERLIQCPNSYCEI